MQLQTVNRDFSDAAAQENLSSTAAFWPIIAPPLIMSEGIAEKGVLIIEEAIMETERELNL